MIVIVCIYVCFLSMHFSVKLWKLDDRSDDDLNGRIDPRLSEKVGFPAKNIPFRKLRDARLRFSRSPLPQFPFRRMRDCGFADLGFRNILFAGCGMQDT